MEFIDRFNTELWCTSHPDKHKGFVLYALVRPQMIQPGRFRYAVKEVKDADEDIEFNMLTLDGASGKADPLRSIRNAEFLVKAGSIVGINIDGDCVIRKDLVA